MNPPYILAIDQGTSSTKSLIFNAIGEPIAKGVAPLKTMYLKNGFVEQDPEGIFQNVQQSIKKCLAAFKKQGAQVTDIRVCGISNQRETFILWDKNGTPLYNAIVWQCKRSISICERLKNEGFEPQIKAKTGLLIDPYFSGTKLLWLFENVPAVKTAILKGEAYFGTVDTWLLYQFSGGKSYCTDYTNASRTLFFNLQNLDWDADLLKQWGLERLNLPELKPSASDFGQMRLTASISLPITAMIGDSHAAAFGEGCFSEGTAKATLGTGCSILMNIGDKPKWSDNGMLTTICWSMAGRIDYALEGAIVSCGSTIEWLKNELNLFKNSKSTENMAKSVDDNQGVYLIPAFSGLGAPHWDMNRKATLSGLSFDSTKNHIVRAALESIPYQIKDVIVAMEQAAKMRLQQLNTDGGMTSNGFVMQFLTDLLNISVVNIGMSDVSALGAAYLAGLQGKIYRDLKQLESFNAEKMFYKPNPEQIWIQQQYVGWQKNLNV
ncbi:MAG: glycerol kinase GlpK [Bacteroidota bacterium]|jgi:glycerol kinase